MAMELPDISPPARHLLRLVRLKGMRFILLYEWMTRLPVKPAHVLTYAGLVSLKTAQMNTRVSDLAVFAQRGSRSVRRHLGELERAGLVRRRARYNGRRRTANAYDLLWHPAMPAELRGGRYVGGGTEEGDAGVSPSEDIRGLSEGTRASSQFRNAEGSDQQAGKSECVDEDLPVDVREALARAVPGQVDDCRRVVREATKALAPDQARRVSVLALRKLMARCERAQPSNPAGLLRACLLPEAMNNADAHSNACLRMREQIKSIDEQLQASRNGFSALHTMRKRALDVRTYVAQHLGVFGAEPGDIPPPCADDPELGRILSEVEQLQELVRGARERDDPTDANRAEEGLHRLERVLDELLRKRRG